MALVILFAPSFDGDLASSPEALSAVAASAWVSWVVNLLFAEWWLQRKPKKGARAHRAR